MIGKIGSGGNGNIYLANHKRLGKKVVLKADKRKLTTDEQLLRREVDVLKNLNNPYIPQVYDYFTEDSIVYTVMEYIEGESLDKILDQEKKFSQPQVIKWAAQLLSALCYLHAPIHGNPPKGFIHSDIKPSNLMRKPNGEICLIDFNVALALGEEHAIGKSAGYASPEHYGLDFSSIDSKSEDSDVTNTIDLDSTATLQSNLYRKKIVPDARSDIYAVGATLYRLLSGERPAKNALDVVPLSDKIYNAEIVAIITKAMNPNPNLRYQTAQEMRDAFVHLRDNDPRLKRYKRQLIIARSILISLIIVGTLSSFIGLRRIQLRESWFKLIEYSRNEFQEGNYWNALKYVLQTYPEKNTWFTPDIIPQAQEVLTEVLGVYDLADDFNVYKTVQLPSAPLDLELSSDASTAVCIYEGNLAIIDLETASIITTLKTEKSALAEVKYLNENTIVYAGVDGITVYDILNNKELWKGEEATAITVSGDGKTVAAVYKDNNYATIYHSATGEVRYIADFRGRSQSIAVNDIFINPSNNLFCLNYDGSKLALSFSDGSLSVLNLDLKSGNEDIEIFDNTTNYDHFEGGFYEQYLAFAATNDNLEESVFTIIDTDSVTQAGGFQSEGYYFTSANENGIIVGVDNVLVKIDPVSGDQQPLVDISERINQYSYDGVFTMISADNHIHFFDEQTNEIGSFEKNMNCNFMDIKNDTAIIGSSDSSTIWIAKYEDHSDAEIAVYDPEYGHDEARLSGDSKTIMLFSYDKFRICNLDGEVIKDVIIPNSGEVYDQQFIRNGEKSYLEVTYNNGDVKRYDASNGELIETRNINPPDLSLYEEFETEKLRVESPLHGTPKVYSKESGKLIAELDDEAYLTYISEIGDYLVAQYVTTDNKYYGYLMNQKCEILAYLPNLCDVLSDAFLFDYPSGHIRKAKLYELEELQEMARDELKEEK